LLSIFGQIFLTKKRRECYVEKASVNIKVWFHDPDKTRHIALKRFFTSFAAKTKTTHGRPRRT